MLTQNNYRPFKKSHTALRYCAIQLYILIDHCVSRKPIISWNKKSIPCNLMTTNISVVYKGCMRNNQLMCLYGSQRTMQYPLL